MRPLSPAINALGLAALLALPTAHAEERVQVLASFSILADMVENVGGEHVEVTALVGPDSDAHVYSPRPTDARALAEADLVVFNGLQFEGWMERLVEASDYTGPLVITTEGIEALAYAGQDHAGHEDYGHSDHDEHDHASHDDHDHGEHEAHGHASHDAHDHGDQDPHAWQNLIAGKRYVANIRDGLIEADPENADAYTANAARYLDEIDAADDEVRTLIGEIPATTSVITGHASFGHFAHAYGLRFMSLQGLSTDAEPSAADMAGLIEVIHEQDVRALFHENMTSPALLEQLAEETGLPIAGTLYADALASEGEASTWLGMMRHNAHTLHDALAEPGHDDHDHDHDHEDHGHEH
ncbi:metal ABC transporter solute-binding protein, Zn/Mn family [Halomonas marinisediminis]|uniref:Metal ABC transporter substrate-binding protein n=1 Tax=Halomonas marinisediminis TaxID=2546095 RepID=A0ABY2D9U2_9GAMM|nr:zinc ABC transporter substrate-binding protein [Halomonas marinisediminis]TDB04654.1 metal ABC transporter substrate-binding protein [Halomonas marinisediminis]